MPGQCLWRRRRTVRCFGLALWNAWLYEALAEANDRERAAQNALTHAYQRLQERAVARGRSTLSPQDIKTFTEALAACRDGRHADAEASAKDIRLKLQDSTPIRSN